MLLHESESFVQPRRQLRNLCAVFEYALARGDDFLLNRRRIERVNPALALEAANVRALPCQVHGGQVVLKVAQHLDARVFFYDFIGRSLEYEILQNLLAAVAF